MWCLLATCSKKACCCLVSVMTCLCGLSVVYDGPSVWHLTMQGARAWCCLVMARLCGLILPELPVRCSQSFVGLPPACAQFVPRYLSSDRYIGLTNERSTKGRGMMPDALCVWPDAPTALLSFVGCPARVPTSLNQSQHSCPTCRYAANKFGWKIAGGTPGK